jgi:uncharacterized protein (DUF58 family)
MRQALRRRIERASAKWLFQLRANEPGEVLLSRRRIFIVPTWVGLGFSGLLLLLLIGATNYQLGLGFALTFLLTSCALVDMVATYQNLVLLRLSPGRAQPVFAGEPARFELLLNNRTGRDRYALWFGFLIDGEERQVTDVAAGASADLVLTTPTVQRGWLYAPRVRLVTRFPLGLFRAWSYWQPDLKALVYPFPESESAPLPRGSSAGADGHGRPGTEHFGGIRTYQPGDPMRHLAWRQIARLDPALGGVLVTKQFEDGQQEQLELDFEALAPELPLELRLSRMTRWVLDAEQRAVPYGLRLGALVLAPAHGAAQQAACLRALALYGSVDAPP